MIIYDVLQNHCDKRCSHKNWSLLLMSPLAETNEGEGAHHVLRLSIKKVI